MIKIPVNALKEARKLLTRLPFTRSKLPALNHVLARTDHQGIFLAVTDLDVWLETRISLASPPTGPGTFLIPAAALAAVVKADKGSEVRFLPKGRKGKRELKLATISGGMKFETTHPAADQEDFPARPVVEGPSTEIPAATFEALKAVSRCASREESRHILNGVLFTPDGGGTLIAVDGKRLAGAPAKVPERPFVLPNTAVKVLAHRQIASEDATIIQPEDPELNLVAFRSGDAVLLCKTPEGNYPAYQQVIPDDCPASVTIAEDRRPALVKWLRDLRGSDASVQLQVEKPGRLTLLGNGVGGNLATLHVPAETSGDLPVIAFNPAFLADALEIGGTLRLSDERSPGLIEGEGGRFCVVMPMRNSGAGSQVAAHGARTAA